MDKAIVYELQAHNVKDEDIEVIMEKVKNRLSEKNIDTELVKLGYQKVFTVDYDEYDMDDFLDIQYMESR